MEGDDNDEEVAVAENVEEEVHIVIIKCKMGSHLEWKGRILYLKIWCFAGIRMVVDLQYYEFHIFIKSITMFTQIQEDANVSMESAKDENAEEVKENGDGDAEQTIDEAMAEGGDVSKFEQGVIQWDVF